MVSGDSKNAVPVNNNFFLEQNMKPINSHKQKNE